jgi:predicted membrane-bound spermidine synthase
VISAITGVTCISCASFLYQLCCAQVLSLHWGSTYSAYSLIFGGYLFCLAVGALASERMRLRRSLFVGVQWIACLGIGAFLLLPSLREQVHVVLFLSYFLGLASGLELPFFYQSQNTAQARAWIIGFDYFGMFAGCVAYALLFLPEFGVLGTLQVALGLHIVGTCFVLLMSIVALQPDVAVSRVSLAKRVVGLAVVVGFCSYAVEFGYLRLLKSSVESFPELYPVYVGVYLLLMGLGSWIGYQYTVSLSRVFSLLAILLAALPHGTWWLLSWFELRAGLTGVPIGKTIAIVVLLSGVLALFAGFEFAALLRLAPVGKAGLILGCLALGASLFVLVEASGLFEVVPPGYLLLIVAAVYAFMGRDSILSLRRLTIVWALLVTSVVGLGFSEQLHLKSFYWKFRLPDLSVETTLSLRKNLMAVPQIQRFHTRYQTLDIVHGSEPAIQVSLDMSPQLDSSTWRTYHESAVVVALLLWKRARSESPTVTILGGGDGLLVRSLRELSPVLLGGPLDVTLVELDPRVLELSRSHPSMVFLNDGHLGAQNLDVVFEDAVVFLKDCRKRMDVVLIDFPYPTSVELSRLYTVEFYERLKNCLHSESIVVLDAPIWRTLGAPSLPDNVTAMFATLRAAGFGRLMSFGVIEPFIVLSMGGSRLHLEWSPTELQLLRSVSNRAFSNLVALPQPEDHETKDAKVNRWFQPNFFSWTR